MVKVSIIIPFHFSPNWDQLLSRCLKSIEAQTFKDYEIILLKRDRAAKTQNDLMQMAQGELIKILHADDYFTDKDSLQRIVRDFGSLDYWQASGCLHDDGTTIFHSHYARYSQDIHKGNNTIGSPSVLTLRNDLGVTFDEDSDWLYDCTLYKKLYNQYGPPKILDELSVVIGLHNAQLTHSISQQQKDAEVVTMTKRYA